ncbi:hypothetical protein J2Z44_004296 [Clostridium punense]|uniref:HNH endonuclease n=1 Tax=Clostridium punense TaxID=1054297 RepID=A0ABS4K9I0_9CLOT|nr:MULTISPECIES: hypothetical protein [Clostridium]EQB88361.1 hypothetical protein M918_24595 [Clostridium sp. BL8]MBP2024427.1 hypothetical protein [Clostridium punense]
MAKVKKVKDKQRAKLKAKKKSQVLQELRKNEDDVLYICTECGEQELIPEEVVMHFDLLDQGDIGEPPAFYCEKCSGIMKPKFYEGVHNITYTYEE